MKRAFIFIWLVLIGCVSTGCASPPAGGGLHADDPAVKLDAIVRAGRQRDRSAIPGLVEQLDSDDGAVRMLAINALERITGTRMGYNPYAPVDERRPAVQRWVESVRQGRFAHNNATP